MALWWSVSATCCRTLTVSGMDTLQSSSLSKGCLSILYCSVSSTICKVYNLISRPISSFQCCVGDTEHCKWGMDLDMRLMQGPGAGLIDKIFFNKSVLIGFEGGDHDRIYM